MKIDSCETVLNKEMYMSSTKAMYETELIKSFGPNNPSRIYKYTDKVTLFQFQLLTIPPLQHQTWRKLHCLMCTSIQYSHAVYTSTLLPLTVIPTPQCTCNDIVFSEEEVFQELSTLDPSKAAGCDSIGPRILKHCALALYSIFPSPLFS